MTRRYALLSPVVPALALADIEAFVPVRRIHASTATMPACARGGVGPVGRGGRLEGHVDGVSDPDIGMA